MGQLALATSAAWPTLTEDDRLMLAPLAALGHPGTPVRWDDPTVRWPDFDAVVVRSTWDYSQRLAEFDAWLGRLAVQGVRVMNPVDVMRSNFDKSYLLQLASLGVPIVPTHWIARGDPRPVAELLGRLPWEEVVVKPGISAGAYRTHRGSRQSFLQDDAPLREVLRDADALVQPFLREIVATGEWSFVYFGGALSHVVLKQARSGDFRVQWIHGGRHRLAQPSAQLVRDAEAVMQHVPPGCVFARVDGVEVQGRLLLMELELIEPYLFLAESEGAAPRLAEALCAALATQGSLRVQGRGHLA